MTATSGEHGQPSDMECRWCGLTATVATEHRPGTCGSSGEDHEWGWWTSSDGSPPDFDPCPSCGGTNMAWDPTVNGNVVPCGRCVGGTVARSSVASGGSSAVTGGDAGASSATSGEVGHD